MGETTGKDGSMGITDELREWFKDRLFMGNGWQELQSIADRIDAEHEEAIQQALMDEGGVPATDENMAEHGWVRLPKDADGDYIHIGDVLEWVRYKDGDQTIVRTVSGIGNGVFFAWSDEQGRYAQYEAHAYRHHHAPTVEDVLMDLLGEWSDEGNDATPTELAEKYAKRLTLADGEDA